MKAEDGKKKKKIVFTKEKKMFLVFAGRACVCVRVKLNLLFFSSSFFRNFSLNRFGIISLF